MTSIKSLIVAALLTSVAAVSFAQAPDPAMSKGAPSAVAKTMHHKKHRHHHHHHAHHNTAGMAATAGK